MSAPKIKIGAVQIECKRDKEDNLKRALSIVQLAGEKGIQALTLPDYWYTGLPQKGMNTNDLRALATTFPGSVTDGFSSLAKKYGMHIFLGTLLEVDRGDVYCASPLIGPNGSIIGKVRKFHPENASVKAEIDCGVTPANDDYQVFQTEIGNLSAMLDMDAVAIEVPRILGLKNADVIFWPVSWMDILQGAIHLYGQIAAVSSACIVVIANLAGPVDTCMGPLMCEGGSGVMAINLHDFSSLKQFSVDYIVRAHNYQEDLVYATVDLEWVKQRQQYISDTYPFWRRPETYKLILDKEADKKRHHGKFI